MALSDSTMVNAPLLLSQIAEQYDEPSWLRARREAAWDKFVSMPIPRIEKTNLDNRSFDIVDARAVPLRAENQTARELVGKIPNIPCVYVRDGNVESSAVPADLAAKGVIYCSLHEAAQSHADLVKQYLGTVVADEDTKWHALSSALWQGGAFLYVPRNVSVDEPFLFLHSQSSTSGAYPRVLVVGEEGSSFSVMEVVLEEQEESTSVHSQVVEVIGNPASRITYAFFSHSRKGATHFVTRRALVRQDARVEFIGANVGDAFTVELVENRLAGAGSSASTNVIGVGHGRERMDLTASMVHEGHHSESNILLYGVLTDRANSLFRSSTHIKEGAVAAGSEQSDRMLVLDSRARADAIPMLLIDENDVERCGHAASVGKLDPNHIYYLMARGIPEKRARKMIVWGYLEPTLARLPLMPVRDLAEAIIDEVLV